MFWSFSMILILCPGHSMKDENVRLSINEQYLTAIPPIKFMDSSRRIVKRTS